MLLEPASYRLAVGDPEGDVVERLRLHRASLSTQCNLKPRRTPRPTSGPGRAGALPTEAATRRGARRLRRARLPLRRGRLRLRLRVRAGAAGLQLRAAAL